MDSSNAGCTLESEDTVIKLTKGRWIETLKDNTLSGCTTTQLLCILLSGWRYIDWKIFTPRIAMLLVLSMMNSVFALFDSIFYSRAIKRAKILRRPLFVLGIPRSGTTLLHNLLSLDEQFRTPNTFEVGWPSSFLTMQRFASCWPLRNILSDTRPMDALPLSWTTAQEDEVAVNVLSGGKSPLMCLHYMRDYRRYQQLISFETPEGRQALPEWLQAFKYLCAKLCVRLKERQRRLLFKSPNHTGRVGILDKYFEHEAQFVLIHRNPYDVFQSGCEALVDQYIRPCAALQTFDGKDAQNYVLEQGQVLHTAFMQDKVALGRGRLAIVSFDDLVRDQVEAMRKIYETLGMRFDSNLVARIEAHAAQTANFRRNSFRPLGEQGRALVRRQWKAMFDDFGYEQ